MSVVLNGTSQYLKHAAAVTYTEPFTICAWIKPAGKGVQPAVSIEDNNYKYKITLFGASGPGKVNAYGAMATGKSCLTTTNWSTGSWQHFCGVYAGNSDRRSFLDGGGKGTNTDLLDFTSAIDQTVLGAYNEAYGWSGYVNGKLAHVTIWNCALTDVEVANLAGGANAQTVQAASILAHWELLNNGVDAVGSYDMTAYGSPTWDTGDTPPVASIGYTERWATITGVGSLDVAKIATVQKSGIIIPGAGSLDVKVLAPNANDIGKIFPSIVAVNQPGWENKSDGAPQWNNPKPQTTPLLVGAGSPIRHKDVAARETEFSGLLGVSQYEQQWYELAHLLPRLEQDLGNVISDQTIFCDFYNADRENSITVTSIINDLGGGFEVTGVPAVPFTLDPQDGFAFTITAKTAGDLTIDGTYTFVTSDAKEYTIYVIGSRVVMFPIRPEAPFREHLLFDTKIIEAIDTTEQRIANRKYPRGMFEATFKGNRKRIEMILFDRQKSVVAMPAWHEPAFLTSAGSVDDLTVNVNTTDYANFYVGGYAIILEDENTYDALKIESMTGTSLTFESGLSYNYTTKAQVMPLMTCYIEASSASMKKLYNEQDFNLRIHVDPTPNDIASTEGWNTYDGDLLLDDPNLVRGGVLSEALRTKVFVLDNVTGLRTQISTWEHNQRQSKKGWKTNTREELWKLRQLLHYLKGRQVAFYIPTFSKDIVPNQQMTIGSHTLNMDYIGYTLNARERWPKQVIRVVLKTGDILIRTIQNSAQLSASEEQLTLDAAWPATYQPDDIERIEFLEKVRIDLDDITIIHYNALGQAECIVPLREVKK